MKPRLLHLIYLIFSAAFNVLHRPTARPIIQSTGTLAAEASDVVVLLESADYLHIRFWYRSDWNKFRDTLKKLKASELEVTPKVSARGKARAAGGINMMMLYIKTEDGQSVSGHIASEICQTAQSIWKNMKDAGIVLPDKWGQIDDELKKDYLSKMAEAYPYIRLCHQNWKADYVATSFYSGWNNNKKNQGGNPEVGTSSGSQNKRSRKDSTTTMQKRLRPDVSGIQFYLSHNLPNLCHVLEVDPALSVVTSLDSEPGDAVKLDDFMPTASLPTYFAIPSAITGGPSINSQVPPEMYLGPDILKASILLVHWVLVILSTHSRGTKKFLRRKNIKGSCCSLQCFPKEQLLVQRRHHVTYNTMAPHH